MCQRQSAFEGRITGLFHTLNAFCVLLNLFVGFHDYSSIDHIVLFTVLDKVPAAPLYCEKQLICS